MAGAVKLSLVLATVCTLYVHIYAQSTCTNMLLGLSPCLAYINGNLAAPAADCCSGLAGVVASMPQCLCQVIGANTGSSPGGMSINQTQALALPAACNINTPNPSLCSTLASGQPTSTGTAPASAPAAPPPPATVATPESAPTGPSTGSGNASKPAAASPSPSVSNGISMNSAPSLMALAVVFLFSSAFSRSFF